MSELFAAVADEALSLRGLTDVDFLLTCSCDWVEMGFAPCGETQILSSLLLTSP